MAAKSRRHTKRTIRVSSVGYDKSRGLPPRTLRVLNRAGFVVQKATATSAVNVSTLEEEEEERSLIKDLKRYAQLAVA